MSKLRWFIIGAILVAIGAACLAGCGSASTSTSVTSSKVTEADLGVPVYPGATQVEAPDASQGQPPGGAPGAQGSAPSQPPDSNGMQPPQAGASPPYGSAPGTNGQDGQVNPGRSMGATFLTSDPYETVVAWYKKELSGKSGFKEQAMPTPSQGQSQGSAPFGNNTSATVCTFTSGSTTKMVMIRAASGDESGTYITIGDAPSGAPPTRQSAPTNQSNSTYL